MIYFKIEYLNQDNEVLMSIPAKEKKFGGENLLLVIATGLILLYFYLS